MNGASFSASAYLSNSAHWYSGNYSLLIYTDDNHGNYHYFNPSDSFQLIATDPKMKIAPIISKIKVRVSKDRQSSLCSVFHHFPPPFLHHLPCVVELLSLHLKRSSLVV